MDTFSCETHSLKNSVHSLDIMIPGPVTVLTTPLIVVILKDDGDRCVANWIERLG